MQHHPPKHPQQPNPLTRVADGIADAGAAGDVAALFVEVAGTSYDLAKSAAEAVAENIPDLPDLG